MFKPFIEGQGLLRAQPFLTNVGYSVLKGPSTVEWYNDSASVLLSFQLSNKEFQVLLR